MLRFTATQIACIIHPDNAPSRNVAAKLGFTLRETVTYREAPALLLTRPLDTWSISPVGVEQGFEMDGRFLQ